MQPTPELFDVIHFEAPQIKKFYEDFLHSAHKTPKKPSLLLKILASPLDIPARKLIREDLFNELLEQDSRNKSPFGLKTPCFLGNSGYFLNNFAGFANRPANPASFVAENPAKVQKMPDSGEKVKENAGIAATKPPVLEISKEKGSIFAFFCVTERFFEEFGAKVESFSAKQREKLEEIKKRKRKSNIQLKLLKQELEKEDFWDKEKISQVSSATGLSESQVYKWFWDQKKKKSEGVCRELLEKRRNFFRKTEFLDNKDEKTRKKVKRDCASVPKKLHFE